MRLIDADALKCDFYKIPLPGTNNQDIQYISRKQIDNAPTIEPEEVNYCINCVFGYRRYYCDEPYLECINPDGLYRDVSDNSYCSAFIKFKGEEHE